MFLAPQLSADNARIAIQSIRAHLCRQAEEEKSEYDFCPVCIAEAGEYRLHVNIGVYKPLRRAYHGGAQGRSQQFQTTDQTFRAR